MNLTETQLAGVLAETKLLADQFTANNKQLYLVGGAVRNLVLGQSGRVAEAVVEVAGAPLPATAAATALDDYDLTTDARPDEIQAIVEPLAEHLWLQGQQFGTIGCVIAGRNFEITTHRQEAYDPVSRKPMVVFGDDLLTDLSRRDFTINAMAVKLSAGEHHGELIDPFNGLAALAQSRLATPLSAEESFRDDPLRMLRAARFMAQFSLAPDAEVVTAIRDMASRLEIVSAERIHLELVKLLQAPDPTRGMQLLLDTGLAEFVFHDSQVLLAQAIGRLKQLPPEVVPRTSALLFDYARLSGLDQLDNLLRQLRFSKPVMHQAVATVQLVKELLAALADPPAGDLVIAVRQWMLQADQAAQKNAITEAPEFIAAVLEVARVLAQEQGLAEQLASFEALHRQQPKLSLPLNGTDIMQALDIPPRPQVKAALEFLTEQLVRHGQLDRDGAIAQLKDWWASQPR